MFLSARWKAYLKTLQDASPEGDGEQKSIYHIYHSQEIWFTPLENNGHLDSARENLKRSEAVLKDCAEKNDALEETLANTPKPSEMLDINSLW